MKNHEPHPLNRYLVYMLRRLDTRVDGGVQSSLAVPVFAASPAAAQRIAARKLPGFVACHADLVPAQGELP